MARYAILDKPESAAPQSVKRRRPWGFSHPLAFGVLPTGDDGYRLARVVHARRILKISEMFVPAQEGAEKVALSQWGYRPGANVTLSLPRRHAILRWISLPTTIPAQIAQMVGYECTSLAPWPIEECLVGYEVTGHDERGYSLVLVVLIQAHTVQRHIERLRALGVIVTSVEISTLSLCRLARKANRSTPTAFLSLTGDDYEYVRVSAEGRPVFSRGSAPDGDAMGMLAQSEALDKRRGDGECGEVDIFLFSDIGDVLRNDLPGVWSDSKRIFRSAAELRISGLNGSAPTSAAGLIAVGAALAASDDENICDLMPTREKKRLLRRRIARVLIHLCAAFLWTTALLVGMVYYSFALERTRAETAQNEIAQFGAAVSDLAEKREQLRKLSAERAGIALPLQAILELYNISPPEIAINNFRYDARRIITLSGEAKSYAAVYQFVDVIRKSKRYKAPELVQCAKPRNADGELVEFKVTCRLAAADKTGRE